MTIGTAQRSTTSIEDRALVRLCHDLRQYVAAGLLIARTPDNAGCAPAERERFETLSQIFERMADMIVGELDQDGSPERIVDLVDLVDDCVRILGHNHDAEVITDVADPPRVHADPVLLRRAVGNVLDNALRAAGDNGSVHVGIGTEGGQALVQVTDDGAGFGTITSGHGQGMSVVGAALHELHGRLEIASGPGDGTTVRMLIPAAPVIPVQPIRLEDRRDRDLVS